MTKIKEIIQVIENFAPPALQESYDNSGQLTGDKNLVCSGVLLTLDCTEDVIKEAIANNCNLIIAHHPIIFGGLKSLTGKNYIERTVIEAIKNDIVIYSCHTNLDNVKNGVNYHIAHLLGLENIKILVPKKSQLLKLETYVPKSDTQNVLLALKKAGAGSLGEYYGCSFTSSGTGRFTGTENSNPSVGSPLKEETLEEEKIEVILSAHQKNKVIHALKQAHPYEEVAYTVQQLENTNPEIGSGIVGELKDSLKLHDFFDLLKTKLDAKVVKHTSPVTEEVKRIAVCGGSGSFLLPHAKNANADVFVTSDFKYHEFFDAEKEIVIADIGHYETESNTKALFYDILKEKFANIAMRLSDTNTNPVKYY